jgi:hypothetical protein
MTKNNNFINQVEKEFDKEFGTEFFEHLNCECMGCDSEKDANRVKQFISQKLQECQKLAYENERKIRRNEKCKTAEINYKAGREELKKEIMEIIDGKKVKFVEIKSVVIEDDNQLKEYTINIVNNILQDLIDKIKNI